MSHDAKIDLACVDHDYRALLFKGETEIVYSNQVGGTSCSHPLVEGFFVLLNGAGPDEGQDPFYDDGPTEYREDHRLNVSILIDNLGLADVLEPPEVGELSEEWWSTICEAWVPVKVREDAKGYNAAPLEDLKGRIGILTYPNSD